MNANLFIIIISSSISSIQTFNDYDISNHNLYSCIIDYFYIWMFDDCKKNVFEQSSINDSNVYHSWKLIELN